MRSLAVTLASFALVGLVAGAAYLVLAACGVRMPGIGVISVCRADAALARDAQLEALDDANRDLARQIAFLERELGATQCTARFDPPAPPPAPPVPDALDRDAWDNRDVAVIEGCWDLDSDYSVVNDRTGVRTDFTQWTMCFGEDGVGQEEMRATNGTTCDGPLSSQFNGAGGLVIEEPGNLMCSDNTFIYRRVVECTLTAQRTAACVVTQPERGTRSTVALRRAQGAQ